jgi:hypothetical protein
MGSHETPIDRAAAPNAPTLDQLFSEMKTIRRYGVGNLDHPPHELPGVSWVARLVSTRDGDAAKVEDALQRAIGHLGGQSADAVAALVGLTDETRGHKVEFRRATAAEKFDNKAPQSFRTHHENPLLSAVAAQFLVLIAEWRLAQGVPVSAWPPVLLTAGWGDGVPVKAHYLAHEELAPTRIMDRLTDFAKRMN